MADENLHVNPENVADYGSDVSQAGLTRVIKPQETLAAMPIAITKAFRKPTAAGHLAEAGWMAFRLDTMRDQYKQFLDDVSTGFQAIANAATVCAIAYHNTDVGAEEEIGLLRYAFDEAGSSRQRPDGLPAGIGKSMADEVTQRTEAEATGPDATGGQTTNTSFGSFTRYQDGSARSTTRWTDPVHGPGTVTTIYGADGKPISSQAEAGTGANVTRVETTYGADPASSVDDEVVTVTQHEDTAGHKIVVETVRKPAGQTHTSAPRTSGADIPQGTESAPRTAGPLERYETAHPGDPGVRDWRRADPAS